MNGVPRMPDAYWDELSCSGSEFVVTEDVAQHERYRRAWPAAAHRFRTQTASGPEGPEVLFNFARFGGERSRWCTGHTLGGAVFAEVSPAGVIDRVYRFNGESVDGFRAHPTRAWT